MVTELTESTRKWADYTLKKMEKLVKKAEKVGYKRWWENEEIWRHYFSIVGRILIGKERTTADELLSRSKAIRAETLDELNRKQKGEKTWITELLQKEQPNA